MMNKSRLIAAAIVGAVSLVMYTVTLAPDILAHDSSEWQATAATLGVNHPPGSPAYTLLGWLFTLVPLGSLPGRVSFVSAVMGAAGVTALFVFMVLLFDRWLPALVAAASLAVAGLWWSHASVATPYNAVPTIIAIFLAMLLLWQRRGDTRLVWGGALLMGLGLGYHPVLVLFMPVLLVGVFVLGPWRELFRPVPALLTVLLFLAGLSVYAYIPIRSAADPEVIYTRVDSLPALVDFVTSGEQKVAGRPGFIKFPGYADLKDRFTEVMRQGYYPSYAFVVLAPAVILFYPAVWPALKRIRRTLIFLVCGMVAHMILIITFSGLHAQYYMPLLLYFSIWAGVSVWLIMVMADAYLPEGRARLVPVVLTGALYFGVLALGVTNTWDFVNHRQDRGMRDYVNWVFDNARPDAVVLAEWDVYTGLQYAQKVEGQRPDIEVMQVDESWRETLNYTRMVNPSAQILVSLTLPAAGDSGTTTPLGDEFYLSIKGRTFQDRSHGDPYPASVRLYEARK